MSKRYQKDFLDSKIFSLAVKYYELHEKAFKAVYKSIVPDKTKISKEKKLENIDKLAKSMVKQKKLKNFTCLSFAQDYSLEQKNKKKSIIKKLSELGKHYVSRDIFDGLKSHKKLWKLALEYDKKGIIPAPDETLVDFIYRANTLLFMHKGMRETNTNPKLKIDEETFDITLELHPHADIIKKEDIIDANKRIPYFMDLSWVAGSVKKNFDVPVPALGMCFTLPQYNGFNFLQMKNRYDSREQYLKILSHELTHMGTVYLDTLHDFVETKAYTVGSGRLGEFVVAANKAPSLFLRIGRFIMEKYFLIPVPNLVYHAVPRIFSAVKILENNLIFRQARKNLTGIYGDRADYVLGRLSADEIQEVVHTNDLEARIDMKDGLKWNIMKTNLTKNNLFIQE